MWLYFNSNGQLTTILEHGSPARVGSTNFEIFAAIEGLNETNIADYMATIKFFKPDLTNSSYPTLLMSNASAIYTGETTGEFTSGETYYGFVFKFNEMIDNNGTEDTSDDTHVVLLDTDGLWKAVINIIKEGYNVQGTATFNVAGTGTETPSTIDYDLITNQLVQNINRRALKTQTIATYTYAGILEVLDDYENGQMFYGIDTHRLYQKVNNELIEIGDFQVDSFLSTISENPVQNKVVTQAIYDSVAGAYKIRGSVTVQTLEAMEKTENMNGYIYNMLDEGSLTNEDESEISVRVGDNVVFVWNNGVWYWDNMVGFVDTSNLVTLNTAQTITEQKTFSNGIFVDSISSTGYGADLELYSPETLRLYGGSYGIETEGTINPKTANTDSIGTASKTYKDLYLVGNLISGSASRSIAGLSGKTGAPTVSSNSAELPYDTFSELTLSANTTINLQTAPTGCYPEYKAIITASAAITLTFTGVSNFLTNDEDNVVITNGTNTTVALASGTTVEISIVNGKGVAINFGA